MRDPVNHVVDLFGTGEDLSALQMGARAFVLFFCLLVLARVAGMRSFSRSASFDTVIVITLGAIMSRVVVGASPALPTLTACVVLAVLHRVVAIATTYSESFERLIKGKAHVIYRGGIFHLPRMHRAGITRRDIDEALRKHMAAPRLSEVLEIWLEPSGHITIVEDKVGKANREQRAVNTGSEATRSTHA